METFFLACFAFGALFTIATVVLGVAGHELAHFGHASGHASSGPHDLPLLNLSSVVGALTWFGAAGFLLLRVAGWPLAVVLPLAFAAGAASWYLIARFIGLLLRGQREMDPADYRLEGTLAQVTVGIPEGGTGEVVFAKAGARRSEAARAAPGTTIRRGTEVVITAYRDGFATVEPWIEYLATPSALATSEKGEAEK